MAHRAQLYRIAVHPVRHPEDPRPLGNFDDSGTWIGDAIEVAIKGVDDVGSGGKVRARYEQSVPPTGSDRVGATMLHGLSGVQSVIQHADLRETDRAAEDHEEIRSGVVFHLPRTRRAGVMAIHSPHGRSVKRVIEKALKSHVREAHSMILRLEPIIDVRALRDAVARGYFDFTLVKYQPADDRFEDLAMDGDLQEVDRLEIRQSTRRRRPVSRGGKLARFLEDPSADNRRQLVTVADIEFDEALIEVELESGSHRTFSVDVLGTEEPSGHPMSVMLRLDESDTRFGPDAASIIDELGAAMNVVTPDT